MVAQRSPTIRPGFPKTLLCFKGSARHLILEESMARRESSRSISEFEYHLTRVGGFRMYCDRQRKILKVNQYHSMVTNLSLIVRDWRFVFILGLDLVSRLSLPSCLSCEVSGSCTSVILRVAAEPVRDDKACTSSGAKMSYLYSLWRRQWRLFWRHSSGVKEAILLT